MYHSLPEIRAEVRETFGPFEYALEDRAVEALYRLILATAQIGNMDLRNRTATVAESICRASREYDRISAHDNQLPANWLAYRSALIAADRILSGRAEAAHVVALETQISRLTRT